MAPVNLGVSTWKMGLLWMGLQSYPRSYREQVRLWLHSVCETLSCCQLTLSATAMEKERKCSMCWHPSRCAYLEMSPTPGTSQCRAFWGLLIRLHSCYPRDMGNTKGPRPSRTSQQMLVWNPSDSICFLNLQSMSLSSCCRCIPLPGCISWLPHTWHAHIHGIRAKQ